MMYMLDAAALNSSILFAQKYPLLVNERLRRINLESLALSLMKKCTLERIRRASVNNFTGLASTILYSFKKLNFDINKYQRRSIEQQTEKAKYRRCNASECREAANNNKYKNICRNCINTFCLKHCEKIETVLCKKCIDE